MGPWRTRGASITITREPAQTGLTLQSHGEGNRWLTVGVSSNIIDASFEALLDAVNYKLLRASDGPIRSAAE